MTANSPKCGLLSRELEKLSCTEKRLESNLAISVPCCLLCHVISLKVSSDDVIDTILYFILKSVSLSREQIKNQINNQNQIIKDNILMTQLTFASSLYIYKHT